MWAADGDEEANSLTERGPPGSLGVGTVGVMGERYLMATIKKKDLLDCITSKTGVRRAVVRRVVQEFLDHMIDELAKGHRLEFRDFGVFEVRTRAPRTAQNPKTLERVHVPARNGVRFKAGRKLRDEAERASPAPIPEVRVRTKRAGATAA